ncbi:hypothetical protein D3C75_968280 [compost metagenome]
MAFLAAKDSEVPCNSSETNTTKNATLKNRLALGSPAIIGNTARITGTAPRNPTQEINMRSRRLKLRNGSRPINTEIGRANRIIHSESSRAGMAIGNRSCGLSNSPSTRNIPIWLSQARPSKVCTMPW